MTNKLESITYAQLNIRDFMSLYKSQQQNYNRCAVYSILNLAPLLGYGENTNCLDPQIWIFGTLNLY